MVRRAVRVVFVVPFFVVFLCLNMRFFEELADANQDVGWGRIYFLLVTGQNYG